MPHWTKPASARKEGSHSRLRFSSEPSEVRTFTFTPWRARMPAYRRAFAWKMLPSGPLVIVIAPGGADWTKTNTAPASTSTAVSYTHLRAHETVLDLVCR